MGAPCNSQCLVGLACSHEEVNRERRHLSLRDCVTAHVGHRSEGVIGTEQPDATTHQGRRAGRGGVAAPARSPCRASTGWAACEARERRAAARRSSGCGNRNRGTTLSTADQGWRRRAWAHLEGAAAVTRPLSCRREPSAMPMLSLQSHDIEMGCARLASALRVMLCCGPRAFQPAGALFAARLGTHICTRRLRAWAAAAVPASSPG